MSNATATPTKPPEVKAEPKPIAKATLEDWFAQRAITECFNWARQSPRYDPKSPEKTLTVDCYIGFWSNDMICPPVIKPSHPPMHAIYLADCTIEYLNKLPVSVTVKRVIPREVFDREEKERRDEKRK